MLGVCLVTLPNKTNANAADNNNISSLTDDNTIQWRVVELDGKTDSENRAKVNAIPSTEPYVKYVLQANWDCVNYLYLSGNKAVILDLNGYGLYFTVGACVVLRDTEIFEVTDSSPARNGYLYDWVPGCSTISAGNIKKALILSGGTVRGYVQNYSGKDICIAGGNLVGDYKPNRVIPDNNNFYYADYVTMTTDSNGLVSYRSDVNGTTYAVSASNNDIVTGLYNYEFSTRTWLVKQSCLVEKSLGGQALLWQSTTQNEWQYLGVMGEDWYKILPKR